MQYLRATLLPFLFALISCESDQNKTSDDLFSLLKNTESIRGTVEYANSPYVTAGNRVYMVGHQDGSFPDLGWHIDGEMGGIWDHPIKLMDGFQAQVIINEDSICLSEAKSFINYPFANRFQYEVGELEVNRLQFIPDNQEGALVEFSLKNNGSSQNIGFVFTGLVDLMPVWLAERKGIQDGTDEARYNQENEAIVAKDSQNQWYVAFGSDYRPEYHGIDMNPCSAINRGNGARGSMQYSFTIANGETEVIRFFIAGSDQSIEHLWTNYNGLKKEYYPLFHEKKDRYTDIDSKSKLEISDKGFEQTFRWIKYNTDWLMREVPQVGRGLSAGIPDYPWWFGADNAYSIQGLLASGMHEDALSTIDLVMKLSREANNSNGRIMHETSTNGVVFNQGNLNETPHFIHTLWKAYQWTGDKTIIDKYYLDVKKGIEWIESQDKDGNGYPDGPGMMEIHGLHSEMIDVAVYQAAAYRAAANFASEVGDGNKANKYNEKASALEKKINNEWWVEDFNSYADFRTNRSQAIELIEAAMVRADTINKLLAIEELKKTLKKVRSSGSAGSLNGYVVHHNWVVNTPMEMKIADEQKAKKALQTARNYRNRFGMYVTGMDRDESQEKAEQWKAFSYVGAVMTLPTGVQAIAELNYGNPDEALKYLKMLENSFSYALPGSMYEVSPDYGMVAQAWNIYAVAVPVVEHFFGIRPNANEKRITISPLMPTEWESATLSKVLVGDNELSIERSTKGDVKIYTINQTQPIWEIDFVSKDISAMRINGENVKFDPESSEVVVTFSGQENRIEIE